MSKEITEEAVAFYYVSSHGNLEYISKKDGVYYKHFVPLGQMKVSIQKGGNTKTGPEWLLNTLPGEHPILVKGKMITNVKGSCQGCCDGCEKHCYAINGARQHHNSVLPSNIKNLVIYRHEPHRYEREVDAELSKWKGTDKVFRWHASGEIEDYNYLLMMMRIAEKHPDVKFYAYTKRFKWVEKYLDEHGDFPSNFVMNLSVWESNLKDSGFNPAYLSKVQLFEWKDNISQEDYNKSIHCRSVIHTGKKKGKLDHNMNCKTCGLCWRGRCKGRTIIVYNH